MPDQVATQNLYDALKSFVGSGPTTRPWYVMAKDFLPIVVGVLAVIVAWAGSYLAYTGVMKRIDFDRETRTQERNSAARARKFGAFFRPAIRNAAAQASRFSEAKEDRIDPRHREGQG